MVLLDDYYEAKTFWSNITKHMMIKKDIEMKITPWRVSTFKLLTDAWSIIYVCKKCVMEKRKSLLQYEKFDESIKRLKEDILLQIWLFSDIKVNQKTIKCPNITLQHWIFVIMTKTEFKNYTRQSGKYICEFKLADSGVRRNTLESREHTCTHLYVHITHKKCMFWFLDIIFSCPDISMQDASW